MNKYIVRVWKNDNKPHIYSEYEFSLLQGADRFIRECINYVCLSNGNYQEVKED